LFGEVTARQLENEAGVTQLLQHLARSTSIQELAKKLSRSRFVVSRWLTGQTQIRLPDLLRFVDVTSHRLLDFCSVYVEPERLPSMARDWRRLQAARRAAYEAPWSHGVLRALELNDYAAAEGSTEHWLAQRLGISLDDATHALALLHASGQVRRRGGRYHVRDAGLVDTSVDRQRRQALRSFWTQVALQRLQQGTKGTHAFNLFTIAERDIAQVQAWHGELFEKIRGLVSNSAPERVVLYAAQIVALDGTAL
jgi:hypothetical protein